MEAPPATARPPWWQWLTVLSLDAPLVAVLWQALFAALLRVTLAWHQCVLLGLAVWLVYAADRWIEGWRLTPETVQTSRHRFYIRWRWPVFAAGLVALGVCVSLALARLGLREWLAALVLAAPTAIYLLSHQLLHRHHPWRVPKEICIALIFPLGCALAPAVLALPPPTPDQCHVIRDIASPHSLSENSSVPYVCHVIRDIASARLAPLWLPLALFGLLCFANLALISAWESAVDALHGQTSLALQFSKKLHLIHALPWLLAALGLLAAFGTRDLDRSAALCVAASGLLLGLLDRLQPRIGRESARTLVDLALLTPAVALLLP